ncbi:aminotransferase [Bacillus sp. TS-2]|nr:aminotransferase [Bacillus sp. TS-2]
MGDISQLSIEDLKTKLEHLQETYTSYQAKNLSLDMSRGKPCSEQVDLSKPMLDLVTSEDELKTPNGMDVGNYGGIDGIQEAKVMFSKIFEVEPKQVIIGGNSSLTLMHDSIARAMLFGVNGEKPWSQQGKIKFICPTPGYDRHFSLCEWFGIEMITVNLIEGGPDMDEVEKLVRSDESIKGIWCVPKYSNPTGQVYSDEVVNRLAQMETKATDFRIFWDNAYAIHHFSDHPNQLKNIDQACHEAGHGNRVFQFASTSKVTFPGAGLSAIASSPENIESIKSQISFQTIGPDKINQLRHVRFFEKEGSLEEHMKKHADIIRPKFEKVFERLELHLHGKEIATWLKPEGGYFISFNTLEGCAKKVVSLAKEAGVVLTGAGATYPYGNDPFDQNIRIAPTYPSLEELHVAIDVLCICVEIVSIEKLLA